ncbi:hypothetical protein TWF694_008107 [Orbilia ellipsospora]|uniref:Uncharacterized protein n=1 Tax=Orbilia ellipsospora TaxID=2528407 RepID=A0AAV9XGD0_9PEZI
MGVASRVLSSVERFLLAIWIYTTSSLRLYIYLYGGFTGVILRLFGSTATWKTQLEILSGFKDEDALAFRQWIIDGCNMTAITGTIIAQLVITSFSLGLVNQTHWTARGCFVYSLVSSLMSVYFASTQSRNVGRLFTGPQIRSWIRGEWIPMDEYLSKLRTAAHREDIEIDVIFKDSRAKAIRPVTNTSVSRVVTNISPRRDNNTGWALITPAATSVLALSAPFMLLSTSLYTFLAGIGLYFGFLYSKKIDMDSGFNDDRNILIVYLVAIGVCSGAYLIATRATDEPPKSIMDEFDEHGFRCSLQLEARMREIFTQRESQSSRRDMEEESTLAPLSA